MFVEGLGLAQISNTNFAGHPYFHSLGVMRATVKVSQISAGHGFQIVEDEGLH